MEPVSIAVDRHKRVYVTDTANHCVHIFQDGRHIQQIGHKGYTDGCFMYPKGLTITPDGDLVVCDNSRVHVFNLR
jgi:DNA-binding beta-propeller fold protein YncE